MVNTTFKLTSDQLISAPRILKWAMNAYEFKHNQKSMIKVMRTWEGLTDKQWRSVLSGETPHTIEGDTVVITFSE